MNILILVGIFLIALIAIVAAVLLVMGERGAETSAGDSAMLKPEAIPAADTSASARTEARGEARRPMATIKLHPQEPDTATGMEAADATPTGVSVSSPMTRTFPSRDREGFPLPEAQEGPGVRNLDGQFVELSAELRTLHTRAQEMEQRISMLMEIIDRLEHDHGGLLDMGIDSED